MERMTFYALLATTIPLSSGASSNTLIPLQFTVNQTTSQHSLLTPAEHILQPYRKYATAGATPPQGLLDAVRSQTGSVMATPRPNDAAYVCPVTIGGQTLQLELDTGSSDLWVFSSFTPANDSRGHHLYNPNRSYNSTLLKGETFNAGYADGSGAKGVVYGDTVDIGGATATSQAVEAATSVSPAYAGNNSVIDGFLGLGFIEVNRVTPTKQLPFFENIKSSLSEPLFAADLQHQRPGSFDFGFLDESKYQEPITYTPVNSSTGFWLFDAGGYGVGDSTNLAGFQGQALADTGTTLLFVSAEAALTYYAAVDDVQYFYGQFLVPCNTTLPDFHTGIGGRTFTVPGDQLLDSTPFLFTPGYCRPNIQWNVGFPWSVYGVTFLKTVYAVFDQSQEGPRIGFANKKVQ